MRFQMDSKKPRAQSPSPQATLLSSIRSPMASKTISLRPMTTPSSSRVITLTSSRPFLPISSHNTILGVKPLKGVDGRKEGTSLLPEIIYIAHLFIITSYCALFLLCIICYLLFLFFRTQLLDTPTVFFFFALLGRKKRVLTTDDDKEKIKIGR